MKVIRNEDKNSNKYIISFKVKRNNSYKGANITTGEYDKLVVLMADGSKPEYLNIPENQMRLLELMGKQHSDNNLQKKEIIKKRKASKIKGVVSFVGGTVIATVIASLFPNSEAIMLYDAIKVVVPLGIYAYSGLEFIEAKKSSRKLNDINKYDFLEENADLLNAANLENLNILENVKSKDKEEIKRIIDSKNSEQDANTFDWNSINNLSLGALRQIKANIDREFYLGLEQNDEEVKTKPKTKVMTYKIK